MNKKDSLAILGWLFVGPFSVYYEGIDKHDTVETLQERAEFADAILEYLQSLKLPYTFVRDILSGEYDSVFYHVELGANSEPLPINYNKEELYTSEHDGQIWFDDNGRLGVWCEVDGFVAWLDEYQKFGLLIAKRKLLSKEKKWKNTSKKSGNQYSIK